MSWTGKRVKSKTTVHSPKCESSSMSQVDALTTPGENVDVQTFPEDKVLGQEIKQEILKPPCGLCDDELLVHQNEEGTTPEEEVPAEMEHRTDEDDDAEQQQQQHQEEEIRNAIDTMSGDVRDAMEMRRILHPRASRNYQRFVPLESEFAAVPSRATFVEQIPRDLQYLLNYIQGQGDNQIIDGIVQSDDRRANVVVNVNFSEYTKLIVLLFTINTFIFLKLIFWDHFAEMFF